MLVTSVELHPHGYSETATLSFRDPSRANPYNVKSIAGLDADDIVPRHYGGAGGTKRYYSLSMEKRDVKLVIVLNPRPHLGESYSSLRDFIYKLVASSRTGMIHIHFLNGETMVAELSGFITKVEAPQFEKNQQVELTVSCDDPMLRAPSETVVDVVGMDPVAFTISDPLSTAPHGFKFEVQINTAVASLMIQDTSDPDWSFTVTPFGGFLVGDVLYFSSEYKDKYLYLIRSGNTVHLGDVITPGSVWPILFPNDNPFSFSNPTAIEFLSITHFATYWGV